MLKWLTWTPPSQRMPWNLSTTYTQPYPKPCDDHHAEVVFTDLQYIPRSTVAGLSTAYSLLHNLTTTSVVEPAALSGSIPLFAATTKVGEDVIPPCAESPPPVGSCLRQDISPPKLSVGSLERTSLPNLTSVQSQLMYVRQWKHHVRSK